MRILERNFRRGRNGEIDIIGRDGKYLVFVEVKYRSGDEKGNAAEAVTTAKQRTICRVADYYRYLHHYGEDTWVRYDVVAIQGEALHWIPNAFRIIIVQGVRNMYPLSRTDSRDTDSIQQRQKGNWSIWYSRSWKRPVWWNICLPQGPVVSATESIPL